MSRCRPLPPIYYYCVFLSFSLFYTQSYSLFFDIFDIINNNRYKVLIINKLSDVDLGVDFFFQCRLSTFIPILT